MYHNKVMLWLPIIFAMKLEKDHFMVLFSYNSFVKLSLYNMIHLYHGSQHSVIKGLHCRFCNWECCL